MREIKFRTWTGRRMVMLGDIRVFYAPELWGYGLDPKETIVIGNIHEKPELSEGE